MTQAFLCCHPTYDLAMVESFGFQGIRFDIRGPQDIQALDRLPHHPKLTPLCIVDDYDLVIELARQIGKLGRGAIELVNEPNLPNKSGKVWKPEEWATFTKQAYPAIKVMELHGVEIPVVSGGISNLNHTQLDYLRQALRAGLQCDVIGYHRYQTEKPPTSALHDYHSRGEEFQALLQVTQGKPYWCTETGWHDLQWWSEAQVAEFAAEDFQKHRLGGADVYCWFQITDGPNRSNPEDHFGIQRSDGTWKPVAYAFKENA